MAKKAKSILTLSLPVWRKRSRNPPLLSRQRVRTAHRTASWMESMQSFIRSSNTPVFFINLARFCSTVLRHTKVYLFALASIFVPSTYSTSSVTNPFSARMRTSCVKILLISSFTRLRKRLIVMKSGFSYPASQIKWISRENYTWYYANRIIFRNIFIDSLRKKY